MTLKRPAHIDAKVYDDFKYKVARAYPGQDGALKREIEKALIKHSVSLNSRIEKLHKSNSNGGYDMKIL